MEPGLKHVDGGIQDTVDESIRPGDAATPDVGSEMAEGFRFAYPLAWVAAGRLDQQENPLRDLTVVFDPILQVLQSFGLKLDDATP